MHWGTNFTEHGSRGKSLLGHCLSGKCPGKGKIQEWSFPVWETKGISWPKSTAAALREVQPETDDRAGETRKYTFPPWLGEPSRRGIFHGWGYTTPAEDCEAKQSWRLKSDIFTRLNWTLQLLCSYPEFLYLVTKTFLDYQKDINEK